MAFVDFLSTLNSAKQQAIFWHNQTQVYSEHKTLNGFYDDIWNNYVKTGDVKGFSIEGMFSHKLVEASMVEDIMEKRLLN